MVPLPIDNELDHTRHARHFIEKHLLRHLVGRFPEHCDFLTLDLTLRSRSGYCFPDFVAISVSRPRRGNPQQKLFGFELKVPAGVSVDAVAQASKQKALVDAVYLILLLPDGVPAEKRLAQVLGEARSSGIGVIRVRNWLDGGQHELLERATVSAPLDPHGPEIIKSFLPRSEQAILRKWMAF